MFPKFPPHPSSPVSKIPLLILQHIRSCRKQLRKLAVEYLVILIGIILLSKCSQKIIAIFIGRLQFLPTYQTHHRVHGITAIIHLQPAPFFQLWDGTLLLRRHCCPESLGGQTIQRQQGAIAQNRPARFRDAAQPEQSLQMGINLRLATTMIRPHLRIIRLCQRTALHGVEDHVRGHIIVTFPDGAGNEVDGHSMAIDSTDEVIHCLLTQRRTMHRKNFVQKRIVQPPNFKSTRHLITGGQDHMGRQPAQIVVGRISQGFKCFTGAIHIINDQQILPGALPQTPHDNIIGFLLRPLLGQAQNARRNGTQDRIPEATAEGRKIHLSTAIGPILPAESLGQLRLAHAAKTRENDGIAAIQHCLHFFQLSVTALEAAAAHGFAQREMDRRQYALPIALEQSDHFFMPLRFMPNLKIVGFLG